jgi:uncharacterized protein (DUF1810 family)
MDDLERYTAAQDDGVWERAVDEVRRGRKTGHWMWFVYPQLRGLGRTSTSEFYGLAHLDEARALLAHPLLGARLRIALDAAADAAHPLVVFGATDAVKLRSCATLMLRAGDEPSAGRVLDAHWAGTADALTDELLRGG